MRELYRGTWVVAYRDVLTFVGDRLRMIASLAFPLLFLLIFGGGFSEVIGVMAGGVDVLQFMYPGIVAQAVLATSLFSGLSVVSDRKSGFLREILVAPVSRAGIVLGKICGAVAVALLQVMVLLLVAPLVGVAVDAGVVLRLVPVVTILSFALSSLGILIASFARSEQGFQLLMQMLVFPMIFLAGVFFPVDRVPLWMEVLSKLNPVTYGVDAMRQAFLGSGPAGAGLGVTVMGRTMTLVQDMGVVAGLAVVLLGAATWAFGRQE